MSTKAFEGVVAAAIAANAGLLIAGITVDGHEELFEHCHVGFVGFFTAELLIRLRHGLRFFHSRSNCFDALVIVASCLPLLGLDAGLLRVARAARLIHLGRHMVHLLPHLRLIRFIEPAKATAAAYGRRRCDAVGASSARPTSTILANARRMAGVTSSGRLSAMTICAPRSRILRMWAR